MIALQTAEQSLRDGDPLLALQQLQEQVRASPADARLRIFLFQLLAVLGQWDRALAQLELASTLDVSALAMTQMYREAIRCEVLRGQVFAGKKSPMIFGQPEPWLALLIESLLVAGRGQPAQSEQLRAQAYEEADAASGTLDSQRFEWIADADSRLGPALEAIINGNYYWLPFTRLSQVVIEPPADLRDVVWMPAHFIFSNGGEAVGLIPTRYPASDSSGDALLALSRKTVWTEATPGVDAYHGLGQRVIATDAGETPLMEVRKIIIDAPGHEASGAEPE
ncbi:type VI secretion system accessory protein TagJ [Polaromonas glacialis]|uniref:type VI secretion system accessory protein TagJ n=1 Tax=Polaromonas glacialis TaxID=866564 RepID=UPI000A9042DA|nr:type VI secretion system accessory protein TagJ [Polaromonas glacialis]